MSLKDFLAKLDVEEAEAKVTGTEIVSLGSTAALVAKLDAQASARSITDEQYNTLKAKITVFRKEIEAGTYSKRRSLQAKAR